MTGLLVLADLHKLLEIASPATLLVSLGLVATLHAERALPAATDRSRESVSAWPASGPPRHSLPRGFLLPAWCHNSPPGSPSQPLGFPRIAPSSPPTTLSKFSLFFSSSPALYAYLVPTLSSATRRRLHLSRRHQSPLGGASPSSELFHLSAHPAALIDAMALHVTSVV